MTSPPSRNQDYDDALPENDNNRDNNVNDMENEEDGCLFSCRCESAKSVSTLLSCLRHVGSSALGGPHDSLYSQHHIKNSTTLVTVYCSLSSLTFHVYGKARQSQASVDMQAGLFSEYHVRRSALEPQQQQQQKHSQNTHDNDNDDESTQWQNGGEFCVSLNTVLECLHVLGSTGLETTKLCLTYDSGTEIFRMELLDERGVLSTAAIPGVVPEHASSSLALAFRSAPIIARMIVKSDILKEAMFELDLVHGATVATVALSKVNGLELAAVGDAGECVVSLPPKGTVSLESSSERARNYPLHSFRSGMKALDIAEETCVSINEEGMMAIQHQVLDRVGKGSPNFVDFIMGCLEEEDDDDDDDEEEGQSGDEEEYQQSGSAMSHTAQSQNFEMPTQYQRSYPTSTSNTIDDPDGENNNTIPSPKPQQNLGYHSESEDDDDGDDENVPLTSVQPLFGTLKLADTSQGAASSRASRRIQSYGRRRSGPTSTDPSPHGESTAPEHHELSRPSQDDDSLDEDDAMIIGPRTPQRRKRNSHPNSADEGMSSPEVVYGEASLGF